MDQREKEFFVFPLSLAQERVWFLEQLTPNTPAFNLSTASRVPAAPNVPVLERSLNEVVRRHEALRTTFHVVDGQPAQAVAPTLRLSLPVTDLRRLARKQREMAIARYVSDEAKRPFDLTRGPLLRAGVLWTRPHEYIFLLTMHHIISDGWSMAIFWRELNTLWSAFVADKPSPLPDLPLQYVDFAVWQREWLQSGALDPQFAYWREQLAGVESLELPTDRPRPPVQSFCGAALSMSLSAGLTRQLEALSRQEHVTLFMTLLAAFVTVLHRYSSQEDIAVGTYIANRNRAELEGIIGFFLNTLVLRTDLSGDPTFRDLLQRVSRMTLDAYGHQDVPFAKLVEDLQPTRDPGRNPLIQVVFQMLNVPGLRGGESTGTRTLDSERGSTPFDLTCTLQHDDEGGLSGHIEYSSDLFESETIARLIEHYRTLLEGIIANPDQRISELPLVSPKERDRIVVEWVKAPRECDFTVSLAELFETQVQATPTASAMMCDAAALTYEELNRRSNQIANYLRECGVGPEVLVGICLERSLDMVTALLGVIKSGGAYLPLDAAYPRERIAAILGDGQPAVVLSSSEFANLFDPLASYKLVQLDTDRDLLAKADSGNPPHAVTPENLAYVIYTSGSTGRPKGVAVEHKQVLNRLMWMWEAYPFAPDEVCCQKTALNFVDSIWELLGGLLKGIPTVIAPDHAVRDPFALLGLLAEHRVTRLWLVPSLLRALLDTNENLQVFLPRLRFWVSSGEPLPIDLATRFRKQLPESTLYNLYGISEVWDVTWDDSTAVGEGLQRVPIGRPIANMEVFLLDRHLQPVPIGVPGELCVGGVGLARGYLNQPELTAERFVPHPYSDQPGARLYRTGDIARWRSDGNIEFIGRTDHQVKLRGFRIELGAIEATLMEHPDVRQALTVVLDDVRDRRLVAYIVPRVGAKPSGPELRDFLRLHLPEYMLPAAFVTLPEFPLTPSGKIARKQLPTPDGDSLLSLQQHVAPAGELELAIADVWERVLKVRSVSTHVNFFDLGGHSLQLVEIQGLLRQRFGKVLAITDLFKYPTIHTLAQFIGGIQPTPDRQQAHTLRARQYARAVGRSRRLRSGGRHA